MTKESSHEFVPSVESVIISHEDPGKSARVFESPVGPIIISPLGPESIVSDSAVPQGSRLPSMGVSYVSANQMQTSDIQIETYTEGVVVASDVKVEPFYEIKVEHTEEGTTKVESSDGPKVETYTCDFCDKRFTWKGNLEMHQLRIHQGEGKKFHCSLCGKQFVHENSLKIHKRLHSYTFDDVELESKGGTSSPVGLSSKNGEGVVQNGSNGTIHGGLNNKKEASLQATKLFSISANSSPKTKDSDKAEEKVVKTYDYHSVSRVTPEFQELDAKIKAKVTEKGQNEFTCKDCDFFTKNRCNMYNHVEAKHVSHDGVKCQICHKMCSTRLSHRVHLIVGHKVQVRAKKQ